MNAVKRTLDGKKSDLAPGTLSRNALCSSHTHSPSLSLSLPLSLFKPIFLSHIHRHSLSLSHSPSLHSQNRVLSQPLGCSSPFLLHQYYFPPSIPLLAKVIRRSATLLSHTLAWLRPSSLGNVWAFPTVHIVHRSTSITGTEVA